MENRREAIEEILESIVTIKRKLMADFHVVVSGLNVSASQAQVLHYIKDHRVSNVSELARMLGSSVSAATQLIDGLCEKSLVIRQHAKDDRRQVILKLSAPAMRKFEKFKKLKHKHIAEIFDDLSAEELEILKKLNRRVTERIFGESKNLGK